MLARAPIRFARQPPPRTLLWLLQASMYHRVSTSWTL
ncbi:hypothetical protein AHF37_06529 [Paragonimus kellicotti]|nr:hypothetical protein AHF37_06529 [Paragonimus kellicotti]